MRFRMLGLAVAAVLAMSCGAKVTVDGTATGTGGGSAGTGGGSSGQGAAGGGMACGNDGLPIPAAFKACTGTTGCTIGFRYLDCCGSQAAYGIAAKQLSAFDAFEKTCNPVVPACGCAGQATVAEDGKMGDPSMIVVQCQAGACTSLIQ